MKIKIYQFYRDKKKISTLMLYFLTPKGCQIWIMTILFIWLNNTYKISEPSGAPMTPYHNSQLLWCSLSLEDMHKATSLVPIPCLMGTSWPGCDQKESESFLPGHWAKVGCQHGGHNLSLRKGPDYMLTHYIYTYFESWTGYYVNQTRNNPRTIIVFYVYWLVIAGVLRAAKQWIELILLLRS